MKIKSSCLSFIALLFASCTNYYIPIESFKKQIIQADSSKLKALKIRGPLLESYTYQANQIKYIFCQDKQGTQFMLKNTPSIEMRITYGYKQKRTVFYFDRVAYSNNCIIGVQSRFIDAIRKTIPLDSISKIEVQDGHKNFK